jgi:hypothetical protein
VAPFTGATLSLFAVTLVFLLAPGEAAFPLSFAIPAACALVAARAAAGPPRGVAVCTAAGAAVPFAIWTLAAFADTEGFYLTPFIAAGWIGGYLAVAAFGAWLAASFVRAMQRGAVH